MRNSLREMRRIALCVAAPLVMFGCGGGGGGTESPIDKTRPTYLVGGTVSGLSGSGFVLQNNAGGDLQVGTVGNFNFPLGVEQGTAYAVTVRTQPSNPAQTCIVANGSGNVATANITHIAVACTTNAYRIGVTVSGLAGSGLSLRNNSGDNLSIANNGSFEFASPVASGAGYNVTVQTHPTSLSQTCSVTNGSSTVGSANVTNIVVSCATNTYAVGGTVTGLSGIGLVLQNNGGGDLTVAANGSFALPAISSGSGYSVTVKSQPSVPAQQCSLTGATGIVTTTAIASVAVACTTPRYARFVYVVNSDNTVSTFAVDSSSGQLRLRGYALTGNGPQSVVVHPNNAYAYVSNVTSGDISAYSIDAATGALTEVAGSPFATAAQPAQIVVSASGFVYVLSRQTGAISTHAVNPNTGALTAVGTPLLTGAFPDSLLLDPSGRFLYVASNSNGSIHPYVVNASTGALTAISSPIAVPLFSMTIDPAGRYLYAVNGSIAGTATVFAINQTTGQLSTSLAPVDIGRSPRSVIIEPSGRYAYVPNSTTVDNVATYTVDSTTGALTRVQGTPLALVGLGPTFFDSSGRFAFTVDTTNGLIDTFAINPTTGLLATQFDLTASVRTRRYPTNAAVVTGAVPVAFNSKYAYAVNFQTSSVSSYAVDATSGALTQLAGSPQSLGDVNSFASEIAVDPHGRFVYVNSNNSALSGLRGLFGYTITSNTGVLTPMSSTPILVDNSITDFAFDPNGRFLYLLRALPGTGTVTAYSVHPTTGALTQVGSPLTTGEFPQELVIEPTGTWLFALNLQTTESPVVSFSINPITGALQATGHSPAMTGAAKNSITADPTGRFLYVVGTGTPNSGITEYRIGFTGALTLALDGNQPTGNFPQNVAVDSASRFAYVSNYWSHDISAYSLHVRSGVPTPLNPTVVSGNAPSSVTTDFSGRFVYVTNFGGGTVTGFAVQGDGRIAPMAGSPFPAGSQPNNVVVWGTTQ